MANVIYKISAFDSEAAKAGSLVVMIHHLYSPSEGIVNVLNTDGSPNENFYGAGICKYDAPNRFHFTVNSETYSFEQWGMPVNTKSKEYRLMMGKSLSESPAGGDVVESNATITTTRTRNDDGEIVETTTYDYTTGSTVNVSSLNARDQFAMNALNGLLEHVQDPSTLSTTEINYYCDAAYKWAAGMMLSAGSTRAIVKDETVEDTGISAGDEAVEVGTLNTTTEKLLHNIMTYLKQLKEAQGTIATKITSLETKIGNVETKLGTIGTNVGNVKTSLDTTNTRLNTINSTLSTQNSRLDTIDSTLSTYLTITKYTSY